MKSILILFILVLSFHTASYADHLAGGHFEYEHLGGNDYLIRFILIRDCQGTTVVAPSLYRESVGCGSPCQFMESMTLISSENIDYGCGTICGNPNSYEKYVFESIQTLPFECADWKFNVRIGLRNNVTFMPPPADFYHNFILLNNVGGISNDSPVFGEPTIMLGCDGQFTYFLNEFTDAESDEITFQITSPLIDDGGVTDCTPLLGTYTGGASAANPFPSTAGFTVEPTTGGVGFTPSTSGTSYFAVRIQEFRAGVLISELNRDGQIIIESSCSSEGNISFGDWIGGIGKSIDADWAVNDCFEFVVAASGLGEVEYVDLVGLPTGFNSSVSGLGTEEATVQICLDFSEIPIDCDGQEIKINAVASSSTCVFDGSESAEYTINIDGTDYCPEYRFFTKRGNTSPLLPLPIYAQASLEIFIGDLMPGFASIPAPDQGPVEGTGTHTFEAPLITISCTSGGTDCVVFAPSGGGVITFIEGSPLCSPDCPPVPLIVEVDEIFECDNERIEATVLDGVEPISYAWFDGDGLLIGTESVVDVHDLVKDETWDPGIDYSLFIEDLSGSIFELDGTLRGTKKFYEPIIDNMLPFPPSLEEFIWDDPIFGFGGCPQDSPDGQVYLYGANIGIVSDPAIAPFFYFDETETPPFYSATYMEFRVFNTDGLIINEIIIDLENTDDWSIDDKEIYWDGTSFNSGDPDDCHGSDVYQVTLIAENCYPVPHCEQIAPTMLACYFDDWTDSIVFTKGPEGTTQYSQSDLVIDIRPDLENRRLGMESHVALYPNPSNNIIQVEGYGVEVLYLYIYDDAGKLVLEPGSNSIIDVKPIERGSYYVKIITSEGVETKKLIVQ